MESRPPPNHSEAQALHLAIRHAVDKGRNAPPQTLSLADNVTAVVSPGDVDPVDTTNAGEVHGEAA